MRSVFLLLLSLASWRPGCSQTPATPSPHGATPPSGRPGPGNSASTGIGQPAKHPKVTKAMLDPQLRARYWLVSAVSLLGTRNWWTNLSNFMLRPIKGRGIEGLDCREHYIPSSAGGPPIRIRIFRPLHSPANLPGLLFLHGGGYKLGVPEMSRASIKAFIDTRACVVVAPDYRKSIGHPFPAGFDDCYDTLLWMKAHAAELGIVDDGLIVAGESAGGGLTAALTLKARATKAVRIAFQLPLYPMLDDRQRTESSQIMTLYPWNRKINDNAWGLYLRDIRKDNAAVPAYAAPARNEDYAGFPPTITFVGTLEPFRDETVAYVEALKKAGVPVEFALFEGCFHGFDILVPRAEVSQRAARFKLDAYGRYVDQYFPQTPAPK